MARWNITWKRDASQDIVSTGGTLYTTSTTVEVGTKLYDAEGIDTGKTVSQINQDGSFEVETLLDINFIKGSLVSSYIIDEVTYTTDAVISLSEGNHTLIINGSTTNFVSSDGTYSPSTSLSGTSPTTSTLYVSSSMITVDGYELGPSTVTITLWSSANDMGGSN